MLGETMGVFACSELGDYEAMTGYQRASDAARPATRRKAFRSASLEMQARMLLDTGHRAEAAAMLREALAICREAGTQFSVPRSWRPEPRGGGSRGTGGMLREGREMLDRGAVGHNHLWFYRDAIEAMLSAGEAAGALEHVSALENYTRAEPLPWSDLFAARGRALAGVAQRTADHGMREELVRIRAALADAGLKPFLPTVDAALAT